MNAYYEKNRDDMQIVDCWHYPNNSCEAHFHSSIELVYVLQGTMLVMSGGQSFELAVGDAVITPSYSLHSYISVEKNMTLTLTVPVNFIPTFKNLLKAHRLCDCFVSDENGLLRHSLEQLAELCESKSENKVLIKGYTYTILGLMLEGVKIEPYPDTKSSTFSRDVLVYLQEVFASPGLSLDSAATHFGYSKSRFSHIFTQTFGYSFWEYITLLRCKNAALLMVDEGESLINAAMNSGFENLRTFYRAFKSVYDVTPTQFVKSGRTLG